MITVKQAVTNAINFAQGILEPGRTSYMRLEEVDRGEVDGKDVWLITFSMEAVTNLVGLMGRDYKTFTVDGETGEVLSMRIRQLAGSR
jgi:hypothetical protein